MQILGFTNAVPCVSHRCPIFGDKDSNRWAVRVGIVCVERRLPLRVALVYHKLFYRKIEPKQKQKKVTRLYARINRPRTHVGLW